MKTNAMELGDRQLQEEDQDFDKIQIYIYNISKYD